MLLEAPLVPPGVQPCDFSRPFVAEVMGQARRATIAETSGEPQRVA